ncbi:MAG: hypothetical protein U1F77_13300 [Kiritimatiellia bacterium]
MIHHASSPAYQLELYSSASSLSDMEIFVFPDLLYSLVLANIMSPRVWQWRADPWFAKMEKLSPYRRVLRLKQFIMDHYEFNLDLDTWGLTTKERELARFRDFIDLDILAQSNALFGYEGDKYYFDIDIRRHFGLEKYTTDTIPYWKTETVEAMDAFRHREGYSTGAGECVSLSTLYAAALYVVCGIPLEQIFLLATPLHSQNYVAVNDGVLTNNRRIVTKKMWFNGTEITAKAQRALRNERVTLVANNTGHIHIMYPEATIRPADYDAFRTSLTAFLKTGVDLEILANFLRDYSKMQKCFQIRRDFHGKSLYIAAEKVYAYEHQSRFRVSDETRDQLLAEIDEDEYYPVPMPDRIVLNRFEDFFRNNTLDLEKPEDLERLLAEFVCSCGKTPEIGEKLLAFTRIQPNLPDPATKRFTPTAPIDLPPGLTREQIIDRLEACRPTHPAADLAFYAWRDLSRTDWRPFLKAAFERNPVSVAALRDVPDGGLADAIGALSSDSIYDGPRMSQPDEVWNYRRGDGAEKAILLANVLHARHPAAPVTLDIRPDRAGVSSAAVQATWLSAKGLTYSGEIGGPLTSPPAPTPSGASTDPGRPGA